LYARIAWAYYDDPETDNDIEFPVSQAFSIEDGATIIVDF